jgi:hypothetical protein
LNRETQEHKKSGSQEYKNNGNAGKNISGLVGVAKSTPTCSERLSDNRKISEF